MCALVGPGNNGADTLFAIARLAKRGFETAAVCVDTSASQVQTEAADLARARGVRLLDDGPEALTAISRAEVVLDGITGIGGRPGLPPFARPWVDAIRDRAWVISVDTPSGQPVEGGDALADAVFADETVTFGAPKPVHLLPPTEAACGVLTVIDIGLDLTDATPAVVRVTPDDVPLLWPTPGPDDDKYSRGVLGVAELVGGRLVDRQRTGVGHRVRGLPDVDLLRLEAPVLAGIVAVEGAVRDIRHGDSSLSTVGRATRPCWGPTFGPALAGVLHEPTTRSSPGAPHRGWRVADQRAGA